MCYAEGWGGLSGAFVPYFKHSGCALEVKIIYQSRFSCSLPKYLQSGVWGSVHTAALLLQFQHWKCLMHLTMKLWLKLRDSCLWKHTSTLNIQPLTRTQHLYPTREINRTAYAHSWLYKLQIKPPFDMHLWETHRINIEKAPSQLIKPSQRWTAASLISSPMFPLQGYLNQSQLHLHLICNVRESRQVSSLYLLLETAHHHKHRENKVMASAGLL